jgi:hypothetical protein
MNGHGTHVAGTAVGSGNMSNGQIRGVAPEASIVFQACGDDTGSTSIYIFEDIHDLYSEPFGDGARVHTNSWGYGSSSYYGKYVIDCEYTDDFVWGNKSMLVVYSAGNAGTAGANTTTPPGTSKNVLTVGASESNRPSMDLSGDNINQIASFSSRGGTLDGRIKPDIVAPGTWIASSWSSVALYSGWGIYDIHYIWMGGTSQAAPHVSGAALLARQYFTDYENITPSAALMKATLINGADDIGISDIPNMNEGWGRLNLTNSLFPEKPRVMRYVDNNTGFGSGASPVSLNYTVGNSILPLKFTLVWSDSPGSALASDTAPKLVNDLDITVIAPSGTKYKGNIFSNGWSTSGGSADKLNNIECIYLKSPERGIYSVNITPATITNGSQPFALVVSGELVPDLNVTNISLTPANPNPGDDVLINATVVNCGSENLPPLYMENFQALNPGVSENITDVAFSPRGDFALLVGSNRTVVKYTTSTGTFTTLNTSAIPWTDFQSVAFNPLNHPCNRSLPEALLVGTNGSIVDYNGTGFTNVTGPAWNDTLQDVSWNDNGTLALIVGRSGKLYTFPNTTTVFSDDFESGNGNWTFGQNTQWSIVTDQYVSSTHSMYGQSKGGGSHDESHYIYLKNNQNVSGANLRSANVQFQNRYYTPINGAGRSYCRLFGNSNGASLADFLLYGYYWTATSNTIGWTSETIDLMGLYPTTKLNILFDVYYYSTSYAQGKWWIDDVYINKTVYAAASLPTLNSSAVLRGVQFMPGTDQAIIVGDGGMAWKYSGGTLSNLTSGTQNDLRAVSFKPQNMTCMIVGSNGTVLRCDALNDSTSVISFPDSGVSFWDIAYRQDSSASGPKPDCSQALLVGANGAAWQYFGYDDHFENVSVPETKTFYGVAFNNTRYPLYGPALLVGHGSGPVVYKDTPSKTYRPFLVDFYKENSSYSSNWLGQVRMDGGLAANTSMIVSFLWNNAPFGSYNITVRVDINNNETSSPPSPDRINEVDEWYNNQMSKSLLLVPEFGNMILPVSGLIILFVMMRRFRLKEFRGPPRRERRGLDAMQRDAPRT